MVVCGKLVPYLVPIALHEVGEWYNLANIRSSKIGTHNIFKLSNLLKSPAQGYFYGYILHLWLID